MKTQEQIAEELKELENAFDCNTEEPEDAQFMEGEIDALSAALSEYDEHRIYERLEVEKRGVMQSMGYIRRLEWVLDVEDKGWRFWEDEEGPASPDECQKTKRSTIDEKYEELVEKGDPKLLFNFGAFVRDLEVHDLIDEDTGLLSVKEQEELHGPGLRVGIG